VDSSLKKEILPQLVLVKKNMQNMHKYVGLVWHLVKTVQLIILIPVQIVLMDIILLELNV
jgi:hypothetical protein